MKLAVISDTHFGDSNCLLVKEANQGKHKIDKVFYQKFKSALNLDSGPLDYLVLAGDILDFSIGSYKTAFSAARAFFRQIEKDKVTQNVVYVPGNHDFDVWHAVEYQTNIVNRVRAGELPRNFRHSVPGVIDDRVAKSQIFLPDVSKPYGKNLFFTGMFKGGNNAPKLLFTHPNLYLITKTGDSILITHGQFFEMYWAFTGELMMQIANDEKYGLGITKPMSIKQLIGLNFPLNQLACSGIGQAEPLTSKVIRPTQVEVKKGDTRRVKVYLNNLEKWIDRQLHFSGFGKRLKEYATDKILEKVKDYILDQLKDYSGGMRHKTGVFSKPSTEQRFIEYYRSSLKELHRISKLGSKCDNIPVPKTVLFGHTHVPVGLDDNENDIVLVDGKFIDVYNCGSWLDKIGKDGTSKYRGAEVIIYETNSGLSSVKVI